MSAFKHRLLILCISVLASSILAGSAQAQTAERAFHAGLYLGAATTQIDGDGYGGFNKAGIMGGLYVNTKLNDKWRAEFQMGFIQKGSINPYRPDKGDFSYYRIALQYIEVPLLFRLKDKKFTYGFGPSVGVLISSVEEDLNGEVNLPFHNVKPTEVALNADLLYDLTPRLQTNVRYTHSILPISNEAIFTRWGLVGGSYSMSLNFAIRLRLSKE